MAQNLTFRDNSNQVMAQLRKNVKAALTAMGTEAVGMIVDQMQMGYKKTIRQTGDLMRDVAYEVERSGENTVDVGNTLFYGPFVHEGTSRMAGRPYIRDALMNDGNIDRLKEVAAEHVKENMEE